LLLRFKPPEIFVFLKFAFAPVARHSVRGRPCGDSGGPGEPFLRSP
jgi:hypothetical protein